MSQLREATNDVARKEDENVPVDERQEHVTFDNFATYHERIKELIEAERLDASLKYGLDALSKQSEAIDLLEQRWWINGLDKWIPSDDLRYPRQMLIKLLLGGKHMKFDNKLDTRTSFTSNIQTLDASQNRAIEMALSQRISLIDGPPGTGKTKTAAAILDRIVRDQKKNRASGKILVCAGSNTAVDNITELLYGNGLDVVRIRSQWHYTKPNAPKPDWALDVKVQRKINECRSNGIFKSYKQATREILDEAEIICCTSIGSECLEKILPEIALDTLLIDECHCSTEPECIIPISLMPRRLILIGDEKPLATIKRGSMTLFARLKRRREIEERRQIKDSLLDTQYRMHPSISAYPSEQFYGGHIEDGVTCSERTWTFDDPANNPFLESSEPIMFCCCNDDTEESIRGSDFESEEAIITELLMKKILRDRSISHEDIGIRAPYYFREKLSKSLDDHQIKVSGVSGFQGQEKNFIIFSCTREDSDSQIGSIRDERQLNFALTRAKFGLIIVGNPKTLNNDPIWAKFLKNLDSRGLIFCWNSVSNGDAHMVKTSLDEISCSG